MGATGPDRELRDRVLEGLDRVFSAWLAPSEDARDVISASVLVKNCKIMLTGPWGTGKTTLVRAIMKALFSDVYRTDPKPVVTFSQGKTEFDVFFHLDTGRLVREGEEVVEPRPIVTSPFKFFNEVQRGSDRVYAALLSLLAEGYVEYRGRVFRSPPYVAFLDRNPVDAASSELPGALVDRVDVEVVIPPLDAVSQYELTTMKHNASVDDVVELVEPTLTSRDMAEAWEGVYEILVDPSATLALGFLQTSFQCQRGRETAAPWFRPPCARCEFNGELCSKVEAAPGSRWVESTIRVAKALAWLEGSPVATVGHVVRAMPFTLGHRLRLTPEQMAVHSSGQDFVRRVLIGEVLATKAGSEDAIWVRAARAFEEGDEGTLRELANRDPAVASLLRRGGGRPSAGAQAESA